MYCPPTTAVGDPDWIVETDKLTVTIGDVVTKKLVAAIATPPKEVTEIE